MTKRSSFFISFIVIYFTFKSAQMSFFLEDLSKLIPIISGSNSQSDQNITMNKQSSQAFETCLNKQIQKHKQFTDIVITTLGFKKIYGLLFTNISLEFNGLLCFISNQKNQGVSVVFYLLDKCDNFIRFETKQLLTQFYRILFLSPEAQRWKVKVLLNHQNGRLSLELNYFSLQGSNLIRDMNNNPFFENRNLVLEIYRIFFSPIIPVIQHALKITIPIQRRKSEEPEDIIISTLHRYTKMMTTKAYFSCQTMMHQETRINQLKMREKNCLRLTENQLPIDNSLIKAFCFYGLWNNPVSQKKYIKHQFFISPPEEQSILTAFKIQDNVTQVEPNSHPNILNYIKIKDVDNLKTHPLNFGGFSKLDSALINFWFIDSFSSKDSKDEQLNPRAVQKRYMAIKKENNPHGKNLHQYRILTEMRHAASSYLPQYYIPINYPNSDYNINPILMMDLMVDGNLVQYLRYRYRFLSLVSKLHLIFSITMNLRFLQSYKIVHLDLKPNNIMIYPGLFTKLIDFGQAFHPEVCKTAKYRYKPGITLPYSPPQYLLGLKYGFTSKSDVYSLGILMFEIIYGKVPYEGRQFLFMAAENNDIYGNPIIIRILNSIITRSLSRNPELRPELDWIAVILRLCLQILL